MISNGTFTLSNTLVHIFQFLRRDPKHYRKNLGGDRQSRQSQ